jgi:hypothetical protein
LAVLASQLPVGSATWAISANVPYGWSLTDILIADLFHAFAGEPHPLHPGIAKQAAATKTKQADQLAMLRERRDRIAAERAAPNVEPDHKE